MESAFRDEIIAKQQGKAAEEQKGIPMPKKALLSVILGPLSCLIVIAYPSYDESIPAWVFCSAALPLGLASIILGCLKIPSDQRKAILLSRIGRSSGLMGCIFALMMSITPTAYEDAQIRGKMVRDKASLRALGEALRAYYDNFWNNYPPNLTALTAKETYDPPIHRGGQSMSIVGPFIDKIPVSAFNRAFPRYYTLPSIFWMIWYPGPDRKFDITLGPQNREIDMWIAYGEAMPLWVLNNLYDPTNGIISKGDMARWNGGAGVEARVPPKNDHAQDHKQTINQRP